MTTANTGISRRTGGGVCRVRDAVRELQRGYGLTTVFGNPGSTEAGFLRDWPTDFRYVLGLHESVVVAMADGYAHATDQTVLVCLHSAGGLGNGLGQLVTAFHNRTPMIVLAGQQTRALLPNDPFLGAPDATLFPKPYVKGAVEPHRPADVPRAIAQAFHLATQPPRGPVFVSVPADDWDAPAEPVPPRHPIAGCGPDPAALAPLAAALNASQRPALVVGPGVDADSAVPAVVALAERTRAGVWASPMSWRASYPEDHPQFLGFLPPEERGCVSVLQQHDLVVVLGAPVFTYHVDRGRADRPLPPLFLVSDDEHILARAREGRAIRSGIRAAVQALATHVTGRVTVSGRPLPVRPVPPGPPPETTPVSAAMPTAIARAISAASVFTLLADLWPPDAILVEEIPSHLLLRRTYLPIRATHTGLLSTGGGTLGYGLPAAVGAAIGAPHRPVIAVVGDGSAMYGIQALWTAAREQLPITVIILDNGGYAAVDILAGAQVHRGTHSGGKLPGTELGGIDFAALATSMGCHAHHVRDSRDLTPALTAALTTTLAPARADPRPTVVHIAIDPQPLPLY